LEERIQAWAKRRKRYGYRRIWVELRREGRQVNRKRVHRLWKRLGLSLRAKKHRKKIKTGKSLPVKATHPKQVWTYDFLQDACENGRGESFNGKLRDECLNMELFRNLGEAQMVIETWRRHYNEEQPHSSLGYLTPLEYKRRWEEQQTGALPPDPRSLSLWEPQEHVPGGNGKACLLDRDDRPMPRRFAGQALGSLSSVALSSCPATSSVP
jgi:transposase InsO family protein